MEIKQQVEYYLSDKNLSTDDFFYKQIQQSEQGYLPLNLILKCKKIKQLGVTEEKQIVESVTGSTEVELNEEKNAIRRKDNKELPEFVGISKKIKLNDGEQKVVENPYEKFEPLIFTIVGEEKVDWHQINEGLMKQYNISTPYVRYGKNGGNFALGKARTPEENIQKLTSQGLKLGDSHLKISLTEGDELNEFWAHHGKHYEGIMKKAKQAIKNSNKDKQQSRNKVGEIFFHNQKYRDMNQLKGIFKTILARSEDNVPLKEPYHSMLLELLKHHDKKDQKTQNLKHFTVGKHPEHPETRCFIAVKQDESKEDFSCVKCLKNLEDSLHKEQQNEQ